MASRIRPIGSVCQALQSALLVLAAGLAACGGGGGDPPPTSAPKAVTSVAVSFGVSALTVPQTAQATVVLRDANGTTLSGRNIAYASSSNAIATVSSSGLVTAVAAGPVTITATSEGVSGNAALTVNAAVAAVGDLTTILDSIRLARALPALGAVIVTRNGIHAIGAAGLRRSTGGDAVTTNDIWSVASNTKAFTSLLLAKAVEAGVLGWDKTLAEVLPDLVPTMRAEYRTVTVANVANHAGGFVNVNTAPALSLTAAAKPGRDAWNQWTVQQPPFGPRGSYYYSNNGYGLLGGIIERAWGGTYESLMNTHVYQPLGIADATWGPAPNTNPTDGPIGHTWNGTAFVPCEGCSNPPATSASGRVHISLRSWARVMQELLRADAGQSTFLTQANARKTTTGAVPVGGGSPGSYAMGWVAPNASNRNVVHDGSNTYNLSRAFLFLDAGVAYLTVTNASDPGNVRTASAFDAVHARLNAFYATGK